MATIDHVVLEVADAAGADRFYKTAFVLGDIMRVRESAEATSGFRGFTMSLVVSQPSTVDNLVASAVDAGATTLKEPTKSFWGYGGVVQAPDGTIWKMASSSKKDKGPVTLEVDDVVILLGVQDVKASRQFYVERELTAGRSFGGKYAELETGDAVKLSLYPRKANAKDAGVDPEGSGSHRIVINSDAGPFTDPDGFVWEGQ